MSWDTAISCKGIHHATVRCDRERAAEEHCTNNDHLKTPQFRAHTHKSKETNHENNRTLLADGVKEDLGDGLACR